MCEKEIVCFKASDQAEIQHSMCLYKRKLQIMFFKNMSRTFYFFKEVVTGFRKTQYGKALIAPSDMT